MRSGSAGRGALSSSCGIGGKNIIISFGGGERAYSLLLVLVMPTLTTHPNQDGASFPLQTETPPTCGRSLRVFHTTYQVLLNTYLLGAG